MTADESTREHIHFVTGRLAEHALRKVASSLAEKAGFEYTIDVLPITVAALMTPAWIAKRINVPATASRVIIPGYCDHDLTPLEDACDVPVEVGPRDLCFLTEFLGQKDETRADYGAYDIEILAEINHAPRLAPEEILTAARRFASSGADIIDVGCEPGDPWNGVGDCVKMLRDEGFRVSIDSLQPTEIERAVQAGAELVLSVNGANREAAPDWGCEVVVTPDDIPTLAGLDETIEFLAVAGVPLRVDPILEPIGFGFAQSLQRYFEVRRRYPDAEMMMGIGNLTELTDVDSAGVNVLLLAICQELGIRSVLTTEVINWARSSVKECDIGRRLTHYAVRQQRLPKHVETGLLTLRDEKLRELGDEILAILASQIKDNNVRIFAERDRLHLMTAGVHLQGTDPFRLFDQLLASDATNIDPSHAFYLGYELCKAVTALTLGKNYEQDEALDWGHLTVVEDRHRLKRTRNQPKKREHE